VVEKSMERLSLIGWHAIGFIQKHKITIQIFHPSVLFGFPAVPLTTFFFFLFPSLEGENRLPPPNGPNPSSFIFKSILLFHFLLQKALLFWFGRERGRSWNLGIRLLIELHQSTLIIPKLHAYK